MKINYWKLGGIAVIVAAIFLFGRGCGIKSVGIKSTIDTFYAVEVDTLFVPLPSPIAETPGKISYRKIHDTLWLDSEKEVVYLPENTPAWALELMNDYQRHRFYDTTFNSTVRIIDTVHNNRLSGRSVVITKTDTTIKETIIKTLPRKLVGYFSLSGNQYGAGFGLGLKTKNDWVYSIEWKTMHNVKSFAEARILFPIKFK